MGCRLAAVSSSNRLALAPDVTRGVSVARQRDGRRVTRRSQPAGARSGPCQRRRQCAHNQRWPRVRPVTAAVQLCQTQAQRRACWLPEEPVSVHNTPTSQRLQAQQRGAFNDGPGAQRLVRGSGSDEPKCGGLIAKARSGVQQVNRAEAAANRAWQPLQLAQVQQPRRWRCPGQGRAAASAASGLQAGSNGRPGLCAPESVRASAGRAAKSSACWPVIPRWERAHSVQRIASMAAQTSRSLAAILFTTRAHRPAPRSGVNFRPRQLHRRRVVVGLGAEVSRGDLARDQQGPQGDPVTSEPPRGSRTTRNAVVSSATRRPALRAGCASTAASSRWRAASCGQRRRRARDASGELMVATCLAPACNGLLATLTGEDVQTARAAPAASGAMSSGGPRRAWQAFRERDRRPQLASFSSARAAAAAGRTSMLRGTNGHITNSCCAQEFCAANLQSDMAAAPGRLRQPDQHRRRPAPRNSAPGPDAGEAARRRASRRPCSTSGRAASGRCGRRPARDGPVDTAPARHPAAPALGPACACAQPAAPAATRPAEARLRTSSTSALTGQPPGQHRIERRAIGWYASAPRCRAG